MASRFQKLMKQLLRELSSKYTFVRPLESALPPFLPKASSFYLGQSPKYGKHVFVNLQHSSKPGKAGTFTMSMWSSASNTAQHACGTCPERNSTSSRRVITGSALPRVPKTCGGVSSRARAGRYGSLPAFVSTGCRLISMTTKRCAPNAPQVFSGSWKSGCSRRAGSLQPRPESSYVGSGRIARARIANA